jgi:hypothetical protein
MGNCSRGGRPVVAQIDGIAGSATCRVLKARDRLSRASPTLAAASQIRLHSPDTIASIAARMPVAG